MTDSKYPPEFRLHHRSEFDAVFAKNNYRLTAPGFLMLAKDNQCGHSRLGMIVSKRNTRLAKDRNLLKRLIRESFRHAGLADKSLDVVILVRPAVNQRSRVQLRATVDDLFSKLSGKADIR